MTGPSFAVRIVARQISELGLQQASRWLDALAMDRLSSLVFHVVASANLTHLPFHSSQDGWVGLDAPTERLRPVRMVAISDSMGLSRETVRRRTFELQDAGRLAVRDGGVVVAPGVLSHEKMGAVWAEDTRALVAACQVMGEAGYDIAAEVGRLGEDALPAAVAARLLVDFQVRILETFTAIYGDMTDGAILTAVIAANVRHITQDPELSARYAEADQPPPDAERRPVRVRGLARELRLPFETVRRRCAAMVTQGTLRIVGRGVIVPTTVLIAPVHLDNNAKLMGHMDRMLREFVRLAER